MSAAPVLRALVVGPGYMGRRHLDAYRSHPRAAVAGVVARRVEAAARVAAEYGVPAWTDLAEALEKARPDAVSVCTPTDQHAAQAAVALAAGAHVLVEKPLTADLPAGKALVAQARAAGRTLMPAHTTLFEPAIHALVRLVARGALGPVASLRFVRRGQDVSPGEIEKGRAPGQIPAQEDRVWLYDHLVHVTYLVNRLAGANPREVAVSERVALRFGERLRARITFRNGVRAELDISSEPDDPFSKRLVVVGREQEAEWAMEEGRSRLRWRAPDDPWTEGRIGAGSAFEAVVHHFVDAVRAGRAPLESGADGLRAMALATALAG